MCVLWPYQPKNVFDTISTCIGASSFIYSHVMPLVGLIVLLHTHTSPSPIPFSLSRSHRPSLPPSLTQWYLRAKCDECCMFIMMIIVIIIVQGHILYFISIYIFILYEYIFDCIYDYYKRTLARAIETTTSSKSVAVAATSA